MNEDKNKIRLGRKKESKRNGLWQSNIVKPSGKFWKRYFNKKVRNNKKRYKRGNWIELS